MWSSEVDCIRYRGRDPALLDRMVRAGLASQADYLSAANALISLRDRVRFGISAETEFPTTALLVASTFRAEMRASGKKVLPAVFGRQTVWISWFQHRFHQVRFADQGDGRVIAYLRSSIALQGLAWLVDDWLRVKNADGILWEAKDDPTSRSRTPM
jgi:hypothetical protein